MDCLLIFPPGWEPFQPYLSLPYLKSQLNNSNISNLCIDINIIFYEYITSSEFLKRRVDLSPRKALKILNAKEVVRSNQFYKNRSRNKAFEIIQKCFDLINSSYPLLNINTNGLQFSKKLTDVLIAEILINNKILPFYDFYEDFFKDFTAEYKVIGISLTCYDQIIPTLILLKFLRVKFPSTHIILGGNIAKRLRKSLLDSPYTNQFFDNISIEDSAISIVEFIQKQGLKENISSTIFSNIPDFDDFPLNLYWSPKLVLPIQLSSGCYWGKCSFCEEKGSHYKQKPIDLLIEEIEHHITRYNTNVFSFVDDSLAITQIYKLSEQLKEKKLKIFWRGMLRANDLSVMDSETIKNSGGEFIMLGIESGSQNVLDALDKGIDIVEAKKTIQNLSAQKIWSHCFFMYKTPGETSIDSNKTLEFLKNNREYINSFAISTYTTIDIDTSEKWILHKKENCSQINNKEEIEFYSELRKLFKRHYRDYKLWLSLPINHLFLLKIKN